MRILNRNKVRIFYANYVDKEPVLDENGYQTGEYKVVYSNPVEARGDRRAHV